ncbi:type II toxin-antitoxin system ParD family antitoxin [Mangrovicella endophytica]|uniref:type II toxin-antitoxin system ParD family antitoxin n=1 Tax=Mangrovicella endophytica TaxID=2066697 RepID=UPI000C9E4F74|nr:type II toxin-antitoxin system ParD family antitoxin [Mangrovicella endophytica]
MSTLRVSLPAPMQAWVDQQTESGRYEDGGDYVRDLIRRDQERASKIAAMQNRIDEGLASGISDRTVAEIASDVRASLG